MGIHIVEVEVKVKKVFCWSDSQIGILGICQNRKKWNCWTQNKALTEDIAVENCYYAPTKLIPADISARKAKLDKINKKLCGISQKFCQMLSKNGRRRSILQGNTEFTSEKVFIFIVEVEPLVIGIG